ncbi:MAG: hypothetical protein K0U93_01870 [Gammaproteobacteria bacterium]|nr:hypothetical protein [Gammaproteobacteria bacterium]
MPLMGSATMIAMYDVQSGWIAKHDDWHSHEHMEERVSIPGFLRGRRYVALTGAPRYFVLYEADTVASLVGDAYLDRLNSPTPWSSKTMPNMTNMMRTICTVSLSAGLGVGGSMAYVPMRIPANAQVPVRDHLRATFEALANRPPLVGLHLVEGDGQASRIETKEKSLRGTPDAVADWLLLAEGYDDVGGVFDSGPLSPSELGSLGAEAVGPVSTYTLTALVSKEDVSVATD